MAFAWPSAEIAVMGAEGACNIIHRKEINAAAETINECCRITSSG
jgi:acetyl-CoA carboxylase carboxyltransferase component